MPKENSMWTLKDSDEPGWSMIVGNCTKEHAESVFSQMRTMRPKVSMRKAAKRG